MAMSSRKHANNVLTTLSTMMKAAVELGLIEAVPCDINVFETTESEPPFYDFDEYARLLAAAETIGTTTHLLALLGGDAGLRSGELIALEHSDVDHCRGGGSAPCATAVRRDISGRRPFVLLYRACQLFARE